MRLLARMIFALVAVAIFEWGGQTTVAADLSPRDIANVLKKREASLAFGRVEWEERTVHSAGSLTRPDEDGGRFPAEDETTNATRQLAWDGERMSYRFDDQTPAIDQSKFVAETHASVCGGPKGNRVVRTNASIDHPMATVSASKVLESCEDVNLIPVLLWAKPSVGECFRISPDECKILPEKQSIEGRECLVLTRKRGNAVDRWCIDAERDCSIMRYEVLVKDQRIVRIDILYAKDAKSGWVPTGWQTILSGGKKVNTVRTGTVKIIETGIKPDAKLFELELPRGAMVTDQVRGLNYVLRFDGTERVIREKDLIRGIKYFDLLKPEPDK